jgi:uncharacterized SAM-binding protein YcdF (DUF218 family)
MFFYLSKTLGYLAQPLVIVGLIFIASLLVRPWALKKRLRLFCLLLLIFFSNEFIVNEFLHWWEVPAKPFADIEKQYEWGILLTGVARAQTQPKDRVHLAKGADRVYHTVQLYKLGLIKQILISGGTGRLIDIGEKEADDLKEALVVMGVDPQHILTENHSRNTFESAVEVKKMLQKQFSQHQCVLITSAFHMRRSVACFRKAGWEIETSSADVLAHDRIFSFDSLLIPKTEALDNWRTLIKEWLGMAAYRIAGYL